MTSRRHRVQWTALEPIAHGTVFHQTLLKTPGPGEDGLPVSRTGTRATGEGGTKRSRTVSGRSREKDDVVQRSLKVTFVN